MASLPGTNDEDAALLESCRTEASALPLAEPGAEVKLRVVSPRRGRRPSIAKLVALALVLGGIGLVIGTVRPGEGSAFVYSKYVDELLHDRAQFVGKVVRVEGIIEEHSIENRPGFDEYRFRIARN